MDCCKCKYKILEENIEEHLCVVALGQSSYTWHQNQIHKRWSWLIGPNQSQELFAKYLVKRMTWQAPESDKIFVNCIFDKEVVSEIFNSCRGKFQLENRQN